MAGGGILPNQTSLQELLMNAQYYPSDMDAIRKMLNKRQLEQLAANYTGMGAANKRAGQSKLGTMGDASLAGAVAQASGQQAPGGLINMFSSNMQDVGQTSPIQSIWDAVRF